MLRSWVEVKSQGQFSGEPIFFRYVIGGGPTYYCQSFTFTIANHDFLQVEPGLKAEVT